MGIFVYMTQGGSSGNTVKCLSTTKASSHQLKYHRIEIYCKSYPRDRALPILYCSEIWRAPQHCVAKFPCRLAHDSSYNSKPTLHGFETSPCHLNSHFSYSWIEIRGLLLCISWVKWYGQVIDLTVIVNFICWYKCIPDNYVCMYVHLCTYNVVLLICDATCLQCANELYATVYFTFENKLTFLYRYFKSRKWLSFLWG